MKFHIMVINPKKHSMEATSRLLELSHTSPLLSVISHKVNLPAALESVRSYMRERHTGKDPS